MGAAPRVLTNEPTGDMNASEGSDSAKRKMHIVWNEDNLSYNEANKSVGPTLGLLFIFFTFIL